jgi:carboxyl-terminal processing protease
MSDKNSKKILSNWGFLALQVIIVLLALAVGAFGYRYLDQQRGDLNLLRQARQILQKNTIFDLPSEKQLEYGMIHGMLNTLEDPFTRFVPPAEHELQTDQLQGEFGGIGARLERDTENRWRIYPLPNSPALEAGIQDGDILIGVDNQIVGPEMDEVSLISLLRGPVGETVQIIVIRKGEELSFTIERQRIDLPSVAANLLPEDERIGLLQVFRIADSTADEIEASIRDLQNQGARAIILDLRNNGGGFVEAGISISRLFLAEGEIVHQQLRDKDVATFKAEVPGPFREIPLAILVNSNTASAAEIVAGAFVKHERAVLIGHPTYGKTTIQYIFDLQDGSSVHVTSGRWWIPGVEFPLQPELPLAQDAADPAYLQAAIDVLALPMP